MIYKNEDASRFNESSLTSQSLPPIKKENPGNNSTITQRTAGTSYESNNKNLEIKKGERNFYI